MTLRQDLAANRWLRAQLAALVLLAAYMPVAAVVSAVTGSWWTLAPTMVLFAVGMACWIPARRTERALKAGRASAEVVSAKLRTLAAPDAAWPQCPVCGMTDLGELADDDEFMDRDARSKVVPYGPRRAHRDCAELVPHAEPNQHFETVDVGGHRLYCACKKCETAAYHPGAYYRCRFCGFYRRALSMDAAREKLIAHSKTCAKRPQPTGKLRASVSVDWVKLSEESDRTWLWPDSGRGRR